MVLLEQEKSNHLISSDNFKRVRSEYYNYDFNKETGFFARWGKTFTDDPKLSPFGPEILDIEISVGECSGNCSFCYKLNVSVVVNYDFLERIEVNGDWTCKFKQKIATIYPF